METAVYIFTGHYGSGKTETAVNFARKLRRKTDHKIALIDLDIVNPFFRSADAKELLESEQIRVEVPLYANTNVDIPALTGSMGALMEDLSYDVVLDVGGDDLGAKAVGRYADTIRARRFYQYFVVNGRRPFTETPELAGKVYDEVGEASALPCCGLINNTNLLDETTPEIVAGGLPLLEALGRAKGVPVCYHAVAEPLIPGVLALGLPQFRSDNIIPLTRTVRRLF